MYTLDTNAIIYYLKDDPRAISVLTPILLQIVPLYISAITEIELFGFPGLTEREEVQIDTLLATVSIIPVDSQIARIAAGIRRISRLNIADATIAATARFTGTTLLTRNVRDFRKIADLTVQEV